MALFLIFRPLTGLLEPIKRPDPASIRKMMAEGGLSEIITFLGWLIDTRSFTIALSIEKWVAWSQSIRLQRKVMAQGEFLATNQFEFSLTDHKGLGMIQACKKLGITPVCTNVLDGGLARGKYTSVNPTGGEVSKGEGDMGPFPVRKLEKLDALFKVQDGMREKINHRIGNKMVKLKESGGQTPKINQDVTTTQIAINYVRAKGAVPLVVVNNIKTANELLGCLGWELSDKEVEELDKACKSCGV